MQTLYRAVSLGMPVGPWRKDIEKARRDLTDRELGSFDEWGKFWITVPGEMETMRVAHQSKAA